MCILRQGCCQLKLVQKVKTTMYISFQYFQNQLRNRYVVFPSYFPNVNMLCGEHASFWNM